jgi:hypothetical protein
MTPIAEADLIARLSPENRDRLELGKLLQSVFAPGSGSLHVDYSTHPEEFADPDTEYVVNTLGAIGRRVAMRGSLLDALRAVSPEAVPNKVCAKCRLPKPISEFRRKGRNVGDVARDKGRSQGNRRSVCRQCRRESRSHATLPVTSD